MSLSRLSLLLNVFILLLFIDITVSNQDDSTVRLSVYPNYGYVPENIEVRCEISGSSVYDHIYLLVKSDHVKPSGIILMVDTMVNECRKNKIHNIDFNVCNSSLILIHINHTMLDDNFQRIDYECRQGDVYSLSSFRMLKEQSEHYYDSKSNNSSSSSSLTSMLFLQVSLTLLVLITIILEKTR